MQVMKHCGATTVPRHQLMRDPGSAGVFKTQTHNPYNHAALVDMVEEKLDSFGWSIVDFDAGLSHGGKRAFWLMDIDHQDHKMDHPAYGKQFSLSIGGRSCWDKTFASGIAAGDHTFVCDNLMLCGEFRLNRKATTFNLRDLPGMVHDVISRLNDRFGMLVERNHTYMNRIITVPQAENLIFEAFDAGAVPKSKLVDVRKHFIEPPHEQFALNDSLGSIWGLKQAFTELNKGAVYGDQLKRGEILTGILDKHAGVRPSFTQEELEIGSEFLT